MSVVRWCACWMHLSSAQDMQVNGNVVRMVAGVSPGMVPVRDMLRRRSIGAWLSVTWHQWVVSL